MVGTFLVYRRLSAFLSYVETVSHKTDAKQFNIVGKWKMVSSTDVQVFLEHLGIPHIFAKKISEFSFDPVISLTREGHLQSHTKNPFMAGYMHDVFYTDRTQTKRFMGYSGSVKYSWDGFRLTGTFRIGDRTFEIVRFVQEERLVVTGVLDGVVFRRVFERIG